MDERIRVMSMEEYTSKICQTGERNTLVKNVLE